MSEKKIDASWEPTQLNNLTIKQVFEYAKACNTPEVNAKFIPLFDEYGTITTDTETGKQSVRLKDRNKRKDFAKAAAEAFFPKLLTKGSIDDAIELMRKNMK